MKSRSIGILVLVVAIVGGLVAWLSWPRAGSADAPGATKAAVAAQPRVQIAPRTAAGVEPARALTQPPTSSAAAVEKVEAANPQSSLSTAIPDIARMYRTGELATLAELYVTPEELAKRSPEAMAKFAQMSQRPEMKPMFEAMAQSIDDLKNQTPDYNATHDEATYMLAPPPGMGGSNPQPKPLTFIKENGLWYVKENPGGPSLF